MDCACTAPACPPSPMLHLSLAGDVVGHNDAARRLLQSPSGVIRLQDGRLAAVDMPALQRWLARALSGYTTALSLRRHGQLPLTLLATPRGELVHITLRDPEAERPATALLRELFALTPVEAQVTSLLAIGQRTADIAAALRIQPNTVQAHLKSVYGKTGCRHQAALLSLVLRSVAMQPAHPGPRLTAAAADAPPSTGAACSSCLFGQ